MLRHVRSSELPAGSAPSVRALVFPEAPFIARELACAAHHEAALASLRAELHARLTTLLREQTRAPGASTDAPALRALVNGELSRLASAASITLRLHPGDAPCLETEAVLRARHSLQGSLRLICDASLSRGSCMIESTSGEVDARLETRIDRFCALLVEGDWR